MQERINVAGVEPWSSVDWPGKLSATIFLQGCPYRCDYCHNSSILDPRKQGSTSWGDVENLLNQRQGLLEGVVFSGGEALLQGVPGRGRNVASSPLGKALVRCKELGFETGLHSAGGFPRVLEALLREELLDWVGLDVKALEKDYAKVTGSPRAYSWMIRSLRSLQDSGIDYEARFTLWEGLGESSNELLDYAFEVGKWCETKEVKSFALQLEREKGGNVKYAVTLDEAQERLKGLSIPSLSFR